MKKLLKYIAVFLLLLVAGIGLCSCSGSGGSDYNGGSSGDSIYSDSTKKIIFDIKYSFTCDDIEAKEEEIFTYITKYNGYVYESESSDSYIKAVYKIPTENTNAFLADMKNEKVDSESITATDVTETYDYITSRLSVLEATRASYVTMLSNPDITMSDVITINSKIDDIDTEITELNRKKAVYDSKIDYTTITVTYNVDSSENFFEHYASYLGTLGETLGYIVLYSLPFVIIAGLIVLLIFGIKFLTKKKDNNEIQNK